MQLAFSFDEDVPVAPRETVAVASPASPSFAEAIAERAAGEWQHCYWWVTKGGQLGDWWRALDQRHRNSWLEVYWRERDLLNAEPGGVMRAPELAAPELVASYKLYRTTAIGWALQLREAHAVGREAAIEHGEHLAWVMEWARGMARVPMENTETHMR